MNKIHSKANKNCILLYKVYIINDKRLLHFYLCALHIFLSLNSWTIINDINLMDTLKIEWIDSSFNLCHCL